ncbi:hypothetical protein A3842_11220 [Paenibacillus sp. P3E]|nr:hypothetical protein A3842_11220 [Paenibacillus sp. P3E]
MTIQNRYPWASNTTPNTADQDDSRYETPGGAQNKVESYVSQTYNIGDLKVTRPKIALGAVGANQLDPSLLTQYADIAINAKFEVVDEQFADIVNSVKNFGAIGNGTIDDTASIIITQIAGNMVYFPRGTYLINSDISFSKLVKFTAGAVLKIRNNAKVVFNQGIEAEWHTIFDTTDDFINNFTSNSSIIIRGVPVKADWFCAKVNDLDLIKTIPDQTNNILKSFRAASGNFVSSGSNYRNSIVSGVLQFGIGYYRTDKALTLSKIVSGIYYRLNGFTISGYGEGNTYLIRTDNSSKDYGLYALYTGELTIIKGFKYTCYNPDGSNDAEKYSSASRSLLFLQGDSLHLSNVWVSGAQTSVTDSNGVKRNGVGIQFSSCVDTYFTDLFVENCTTEVAFGSSIVSGTNIELYSAREYAIGYGVFDEDYPNEQTTSSVINITNLQAQACKVGIKVLEKGETGEKNITNSFFDGYNSEFSTVTGTTFCDMSPGTSIFGSMNSCSIKNFPQNTFKLHDNCSLGRTDHAFYVNSCKISGQTNDVSAGVFNMLGTGTYSNLIVNGASLTDISGVIFFAAMTGCVTLENISLSRYIGKSDESVNRQLFISSGSSNVHLRKIVRNSSDTGTLNQFGFAASGNVFIDVDNLYLATRSVSGSATVTMPSKTTFA